MRMRVELIDRELVGSRRVVRGLVGVRHGGRGGGVDVEDVVVLDLQRVRAAQQQRAGAGDGREVGEVGVLLRQGEVQGGLVGVAGEGEDAGGGGVEGDQAGVVLERGRACGGRRRRRRRG